MGNDVKAQRQLNKKPLIVWIVKDDLNCLKTMSSMNCSFHRRSLRQRNIDGATENK
jgi:hypothetical protein